MQARTKNVKPAKAGIHFKAVRDINAGNVAGL
jgi:hypothetical protein